MKSGGSYFCTNNGDQRVGSGVFAAHYLKHSTYNIWETYSPKNGLSGLEVFFGPIMHLVSTRKKFMTINVVQKSGYELFRRMKFRMAN